MTKALFPQIIAVLPPFWLMTEKGWERERGVSIFQLMMVVSQRCFGGNRCPVSSPSVLIPVWSSAHLTRPSLSTAPPPPPPPTENVPSVARPKPASTESSSATPATTTSCLLSAATGWVQGGTLGPSALLCSVYLWWWKWGGRWGEGAVIRKVESKMLLFSERSSLKKSVTLCAHLY